MLIVDSGTTFNIAGGEVYSAIASAVGVVDCDKMSDLPALVYTIRDSKGGLQDIAVPPEEYMVRSFVSDKMCVPGVTPMYELEYGKDTMVLGDVFMRYHFTVFSRGAGEGG